MSESVVNINSSICTPARLDKVLHKKINEFSCEYSLSKLESEVNDYVRGQYKKAYRLVANNEMNAADLEKEIKSHIPTRTYIRDYVNGRPICYRYTNTLANFFKVEYTLKNHSPCDNYLTALKLRRT